MFVAAEQAFFFREEAYDQQAMAHAPEADRWMLVTGSALVVPLGSLSQDVSSILIKGRYDV
jgi:hypothetical protein